MKTSGGETQPGQELETKQKSSSGFGFKRVFIIFTHV